MALTAASPWSQLGKKRRLQQHLSTTSSDEEEKTLTEILVRRDKAAEAGRIYSPDATNSHTVHFWMDKVAKAQALKKNQGGKDDASYSAMKELFGKALTKLLLNCECYERLTHF